MAIANKILAILGFVSAIHGSMLLAAMAVPSLSGFRKLAPPSWWTGKASKLMARASYMTTFGLFVGFQAIDQHLLAVIFAIPAILFAGIVIEQSFRKSGTGADA